MKTVTLRFNCDVCEHELEVYVGDGPEEEVVLQVTPCPTCIVAEAARRREYERFDDVDLEIVEGL